MIQISLLSVIFGHYYCGMCIPLSDDQHRYFQDNSKNALEIWDKIQSETKFIPRQNSVQVRMNFGSD